MTKCRKEFTLNQINWCKYVYHYRNFAKYLIINLKFFIIWPELLRRLQRIGHGSCARSGLPCFVRHGFFDRTLFGCDLCRTEIDGLWMLEAQRENGLHIGL